METQVIKAPQISAGIKGFKLLSDYMMQGIFIWVGEDQDFLFFFPLTNQSLISFSIHQGFQL